MTPRETWALIHALGVAEEVYRADAAAMRVAGQDRIAEQFERQAREVQAIASKLEGGES